MSQGPIEGESREPGARRWGEQQEQIDKQAEKDHLVHEAERIHAEEAAESGGGAKPKRPWWKFWA